MKEEIILEKEHNKEIKKHNKKEIHRKIQTRRIIVIADRAIKKIMKIMNKREGRRKEMTRMIMKEKMKTEEEKKMEEEEMNAVKDATGNVMIEK